MNLFKNIFGSNESESTNSKVNWRPLIDMGQLNEIINESTEKPVIIFKHSTRCGISRMTLKQFENEYDLNDLVMPYFLDLLQNRDISNEIAKRFGIEHQSPQLILIKNGEPIYNASHGDIYADDLKRYI
ncbi:bacillithiol system redox-active protein YtxJ [Flavobacterium sp. 102]|uniref:bacillithiol system redox-active protein YtxJ n=1 Tax=Flavobacterium sp. 102 TaxID=2135623 RepID=UPI000EB4177B|nr:bacillithiol system redox-active protein YtxJ [Flavobacterium sp. 102]RKS02785.1 bacillithiol system protein YtxJ [Flavobacterium sp. 102]